MIKRTQLMKIRDEVKKVVEKYDFLNTETSKNFMAQFTDEAIEAGRKQVSSRFNELAQKRKAMKFIGVDVTALKEQLKKEMEEKLKLIELANSLTEEEITDLTNMKEKAKNSAKATREAKQRSIVEELIDERDVF